MVANEKHVVQQLRASIVNDRLRHSELEEFFLQCTDDVKKETDRRSRAQAASTSIHCGCSSRAGGDGSVADDFVTSSDPWAEEEDAVLREGVLKFGTENWAAVAHHLVPPVTGGPLKRSPDACKERWDTVVRHNAVKGPWLPEEDELLRKLVGEIGPKINGTSENLCSNRSVPEDDCQV